MRNILLIIEYDGTGFSGWQSQAKGERTVQDVLAASITRLTQEPDVRPRCAGRTDAGVHALGQAVVFQTDSALALEDMHRALNAILPHDIRVREARQVDGGFHPLREALFKRYVYLIANAPQVSPFAHRYVWHVQGGLDTDAMREALRAIAGRHDFASFMAAGSDVNDTVREVFSAELQEAEGIQLLGFTLDGRFLRMVVEGEGFLRHMVRAIAGTLVEVGKERLQPSAMTRIIESRERSQAGPTAPACGLFLESVRFRQALAASSQPSEPL